MFSDFFCALNHQNSVLSVGVDLLISKWVFLSYLTKHRHSGAVTPSIGDRGGLGKDKFAC